VKWRLFILSNKKISQISYFIDFIKYQGAKQ